MTVGDTVYLNDYPENHGTVQGFVDGRVEVMWHSSYVVARELPETLSVLSQLEPGLQNKVYNYDFVAYTGFVTSYSFCSKYYLKQEIT